MNILDYKKNKFEKKLDYLLLKRKKKIQSDSVSVANIIKDIKKNGDKALIKYERKFNKNNTIIPSPNQITKSINSLDLKVKQAIDIVIKEYINFIHYKNLKISYIDKFKNKIEYKYLPLDLCCNLCSWLNSIISFQVS